MFVIKDFFGKSVFSTTSEYRLALLLARSCVASGIPVTFEGMSSTSDLNSPYYEALKGFLKESDLVRGISSSVEVPYTYNFEKPDEVSELIELLEHNPVTDERHLNQAELSQYYADIMSWYTADLGINMGWIIAEHLLMCYNHGSVSKLVFNMSFSSSTLFSHFMDYFSVLSSVDSLREYFSIVLFSSTKFNEELSVLQWDSVMSGSFKEYTVLEKVSLMKEFSFNPGMIAVLFERSGFNASNDVGRLGHATLIRIEGVEDGELHYTSLRGTRTHEELQDDFLQIPEEHRHMYYDLLDPYSSEVSRSSIPIRDLGLERYFMHEPYLLTGISDRATVLKKVTIEGEVREVEMVETEAIYYTFKQNKLEFDEQAYRDYYFGGRRGLFDLWNGIE